MASTAETLVTAAEPASRLIFRGAAPAAEAAGAAFGVALRLEPMRAEQQGSRATLWLGPDEWLLLAEPDAQAAIVSAIGARLAALPHALVDISARNVGLLLAGADAESVLGAGCPLDLDPSAFPVGMCTRTLFGKAEVVLWRTAADAFRLEVIRSYAPYVTGLLANAIGQERALLARLPAGPV